MRRMIEFRNFRNLGIDEPTTLLLNHSINNKNFGDLIIIIGENNSGKSNVLDGIEKIQTKTLIKRDKTVINYINSKDNHLPSIVFKASDEKVIASFELYDIDSNTKQIFKYEENKKSISNESDLMKALDEVIEEAKLYPSNFDIHALVTIKDNKSINLNDWSNQIIIELQKLLSFQKGTSKERQVSALLNKLKDNAIIKLFNERNSSSEKAENYFKKIYGMSFLPKIIKYIEKPVANSLFKVAPNQIKSNPFMCSVFEAIGIEIKEIELAYENYSSSNNISFLKSIKNKIKNKTVTLNNRFNELYYSKKYRYHFSVELESTLISFGLSRGKNEDPIIYDYQSTGFKWFFNFFFNFLYTSDIPKGSIVIMDEPATNLHPQGQTELRKFIKEYAKKSNITFIIATHSPFLINPDNYDELRVISAMNNKAKIDNSFSAVNKEDPDSLLPIKESLTIKQNVLYDFETKVVWVEGITDYNYLTMFKNLLGFDKVAFLPFNGVGKDDATQRKVIERLCKIRFASKSILVDGDSAGQKFKEKLSGTEFENKCTVISGLNVGKKNFINIEDLFSSNDKNKYQSLNPKSCFSKSSSYTSAMKKTLTKQDFSVETLDNFKRLFELILKNSN